MDWQTIKQTNRQTGRQTADRWKYRQTDERTDSRIDSHFSLPKRLPRQKKLKRVTTKRETRKKYTGFREDASSKNTIQCIYSCQSSDEAPRNMKVIKWSRVTSNGRRDRHEGWNSDVDYLVFSCRIFFILSHLYIKVSPTKLRTNVNGSSTH